jgi:hypothetical protein
LRRLRTSLGSSPTCASNCAGAPSAGSITIALTGGTSANACVSRQLTGTVRSPGPDATTTSRTLSGRVRDHKGYSLSGEVTASTNPFYPPSPFTSMKASVSFPPNPCNPGTFTGSLTLYPPSPL